MRKIFYKEITKKETRKYRTSTYHTALSNGTVKKVGRGWTPEERKCTYIFKAKEIKQYQNNGTEDISVVIIYLTEASKLRLLSIVESFESPKRRNSTFKWLRKFLRDDLKLEMSMKSDLRAFSKLRQPREKCSLSSTIVTLFVQTVLKYTEI